MMTKQEKETILRFDAERDEVHIFTADPPVHRKVEKVWGVKPWRISVLDGKEVGWFYRVPYGQFSWHKKRAGQRALVAA
ncbi:MAG: hypothetical protein ACE5NC_08775 [Anaerolineae bacterium]